MASELDPTIVTNIIANINGLYNNLVAYTVGLILFVGAFVPGVISFFQRRQFTREYDELAKKMLQEIKEKVAAAQIELRTEILEVQKQELDKVTAAMEGMKANLTKSIGLSQAAAFHLQANQYLSSPGSCLRSCEAALPLYIGGSDERNARAILSITKSSLAKANNSHFTEIPELEETADTILATLQRNNVNGRYSHEIEEIKSALKDAKKRQAPGTNA